jgi:tRNA pseudouridine38-40 synthase
MQYRNLCLVLSYQGTHYHGWQIQPDKITIQETVERAISDLTSEKIMLQGAGRTDAGVHALGQVANFRTQSQIQLYKFRNAIQVRLPHDIIVRSVHEVPDTFHATYDAISKRYRYLIWNSPSPHLLSREFCWHVNRHLNIADMQVAAQSLLGQHDFRSFETQYPNRASSIRNLHDIRLQVENLGTCWEAPDPFPQSPDPFHPLAANPDNDIAPLEVISNLEQEPHPFHFANSRTGQMICLDIEADGFLYNMVRAIMGTLVEIGLGRWKATDMTTILQKQDRRLAGPTAPAQGLFLSYVRYPQSDTIQGVSK